MKTRSPLILLAAIGLFILTPGLPLQAESGAADALHELEQAKTSKNPFVHLENAKRDIEDSNDVWPNHGWDAIGHIDKAVGYIRTVQPQSMEKQIDLAIIRIQHGLKAKQ